MCIEDLVLGRMTSVVRRNIVIDAVTQTVIAANPNRIYFAIVTSNTNHFFLNFDADASATAGMTLDHAPPSRPWFFHIRDYGEIIRREIRLLSSAGAPDLWFAEGVLPNEIVGIPLAQALKKLGT